MKKKSPFSTVLVIALIALAGYAVYRWIIVPMMAKRTMEQAAEKGYEAMAQKIEQEKEEIIQDLANLVEKIKQEEKLEEAEQILAQEAVEAEEGAK